jgi:hypothetical protein
MYLQDASSREGPVYWFYPSFAFGMPVIVLVVFWYMVIKDTKFRSNDPYRFAKKQYRTFLIPSEGLTRVKTIMDSLGYRVTFEQQTDDRFELVAIRYRPRHIERFHEKRCPLLHSMTMKGALKGDGWHVELLGMPATRAALADFRNTVYDSLEELVDELQWRSFLQGRLSESLS